MIISQMFTSFIIYSFFGWLWETVYCTIKGKEFKNRGFLFGPVCPIYGCCVVFIQLVARYGQGVSDSNAPVWRVFLICAVGSAIAEYVTSWYLEKRFHARWWDYSKIPLNVNGRICLPVTLCFGAAGVVIVKYILPLIETSAVSVHPLVWEGSSLALMAVFAADFALTEAELNSLLQKVQSAESEFNTRAENVYTTLAEKPQMLEEKVHALEDEFKNRIHTTAEGLSSRQKSILNNISSFRQENQ